MTEQVSGQHFVAELVKNSFEVIRVEACEFRGRRLANVRCWVEQRTEDGAVKRVPTRKGISFAIGLLPKVIKALHALAEAEGVTQESAECDE